MIVLCRWRTESSPFRVVLISSFELISHSESLSPCRWWLCYNNANQCFVFRGSSVCFPTYNRSMLKLYFSLSIFLLHLYIAIYNQHHHHYLDDHTGRNFVWQYTSVCLPRTCNDTVPTTLLTSTQTKPIIRVRCLTLEWILVGGR